MAGIVWLASYPKSGNTWLRSIISHYQRGVEAPVDLNHLTVPHAAAFSLLDRYGAGSSTEMSRSDLASVRPAVYRAIAATETRPVFLKVHDQCGLTPTDEFLFPPEVTLATVYVVRHPGDVAVSLAHHAGWSVAHAVETLCRPDYTVGGVDVQCSQHVGSWGRHVDSWTVDTRTPVFIVRYEDLQTDTVRECKRFIHHVDGTIDDARLQQAVKASRFEKLQDREQSEGFIEQASPGRRFFRAGRVGEWRSALSPSEVGQLESCHGVVMARLGYLT